MTPNQKLILNFQIVFPSVATLIAIGLKAVHIIAFNWFSIFLPLMISVPVGLIMITISKLFEIKKETN